MTDRFPPPFVPDQETLLGQICNIIQQKGVQIAEQKKTVDMTERRIRLVTCKEYTAEEKARIVLERLRGESTIAELCRKEGIQPNLYNKWSKEFWRLVTSKPWP